MTPEEITNKLRERFGDAVQEVNLDGFLPFALVNSSKIAEVCEFLKDDDDLKFDFLSNLGGRDLGEQFEVFYMLYSYNRRHSFTIKTRTTRDNPHVPTVAGVWRAAEWHERETFDMFGIVFDGHPDLRRILLPSDWEGYPLRKDYVYPESYGGIKLLRDEEGWPDPSPRIK